MYLSETEVRLAEFSCGITTIIQLRIRKNITIVIAKDRKIGTNIFGAPIIDIGQYKGI